jgi:hypothetical protein
VNETELHLGFGKYRGNRVWKTSQAIAVFFKIVVAKIMQLSSNFRALPCLG